MSDRDPTESHSEEQEPFLLTILPFAGLGLLLILALVWRVMPERAAETTDGPPTASPVELAATAIARWERAPLRDIPIESGRDYILGPEDAPITMVEFSDFECPFCRNAASGAHEVLAQYEGSVRLVFKNFPLDTACNPQMQKPMHQHACEAAVIARCAGEQGDDLFWKTHDALFAGRLTQDSMYQIPQDLNLDLDRLDACIGAPPAAAAVQEDIALGHRLGISGTPVFFLNGKRMSDYRQAALEAVIEHILAGD